MRFSSAVVTQERVQLDLFIEASAWEGLFDRVEIQRSRGTAQGPYEYLHADTQLPAQLPAGNTDTPPSSPLAGPPAILSGLSVDFLLDALTSITVTFTGTNPITWGTAATQITAQSEDQLNAFVSSAGVLVVQTVEAGVKAALQCTGGEAAPLLGLPSRGPLSLAFGSDARIPLVHGKQQYGFVDPYGSSQYFYRARFFNNNTRTASQWSDPFQSSSPAGISASSLCLGYVKLVDLGGNPLVNQEVLIHQDFTGLLVEDAAVAGGEQRLLTDATGQAEMLLVRGSKIVVGIGGTPIARDVCVPVDPTITTFNLLSSANGSNDVFTVQIPYIPYAVRRTL